MHYLKNVATPRPSVFDKARRDVVLDVTDLTENNIDPENFFSENFITKGMGLLYQSVFKRLEGNSDDGIFYLTQSMGGGKTHNLITIGLLALYPELREKVMSTIYKTTLTEPVKIIGISGRENYKYGLWGYIAEQLGKKDFFNEYYNPLAAPGQSAWFNLLKDEKVLILFDELPPYFRDARSKQIGDSNLSEVTATAITNLFIALGKAELKQSAVIITDLTANYEVGSEFIQKILDDLKNETNRVARNFNPVEQTGDEIYQILRKRIFKNLPEQSVIDLIASEYAEEIRKAKQMDITTETPESFARAVKESYPFHPAIKDLFARFKENPGFQQTRGLIRLMRTLVSRMFDENTGWADKTSLIAPFDIDLNDMDTLSEIQNINPKLINAISHDITGSGQAVSEMLDERYENKISSQVSKLLLVSSLATVQNSVRGLKSTEIIRNLCTPGLDIAKVQSEILPELKNNCWYLHLDNSGNFLFKDVVNVVAKLQEYVRGYNQESIRQEIRKKLAEIFKPALSDCYQKVYTLPALDEIDLEAGKLSLIIYPPHIGGLHADLQKLYDDTSHQNRLLFLTGDLMGMTAIYDNASGLKAIDAIIGEFRAENMTTNDPQFIEAEKIKERFQFNFITSIEQNFVKLYFPTKRGLLDANLKLNFQGNNYNGEQQIKETLKEKRKFTEDVTSDTFQKYVEGKLFASQKSAPWSDIKKRAASNTDWLWHKPSALDQLKDSLVSKDLWRANGDWIEIGPFPPPKTSVSVREINRNDETGEVSLKIVPLNGNQVHWEVGNKVTTSSATLDVNNTFISSDMKLAFLCVDSKGLHETGEPCFFQNRVTIKHRFFQDVADIKLELIAAPNASSIKYSTAGTDPFTSGGSYIEPIAVPKGTTFILVGAEKNGIKSEVRQLRVPDPDRGPYQPDLTRPATWKHLLKKESTSTVFEWMKLAEKHGIKLSSVAVAVNGKDWVSLDASPDLIFDAEKLSKSLNFLKSDVLPEGELSITAFNLHFISGQRLLDYVRDTHEQLKEEDVNQ
jgi:hypothetical protein